MGSTTTTACLVLSYLLTNGSYTPPSTWYIGLSTSAISLNGTTVYDPVGGNYVRKGVARDAGNWNEAENGEISNSNPIVFNKATSNWGTIREIFLSSSLSESTGSSIYFHQPISPAITVNSGAQVIIPAGNLIIKRDSSRYETE